MLVVSVASCWLIYSLTINVLISDFELTSKLIGKESYTYFNSGNEIITWFNDFYIPNVYDILLNAHLPKYRLLYKESGLKRFK